MRILTAAFAQKLWLARGAEETEFRQTNGGVKQLGLRLCDKPDGGVVHETIHFFRDRAITARPGAYAALHNVLRDKPCRLADKVESFVLNFEIFKAADWRRRRGG